MGVLRAIVLAAVLLTPITVFAEPDYRAEMRAWVESISANARATAPDFIVIPHKGEALLTANGKPDGDAAMEHIKAIAGQSFEGVFYGQRLLDIPTSSEERGRLFQFIDLSKAQGLVPLVVDYCHTPRNVENAVAWNKGRGYLAFAADRVELNTIPPLPQELTGVHDGDVLKLANANNFLLLATSESFGDKNSYRNAVAKTDYDLVAMAPFYKGELLTAEDVAALRTKARGGKRLLLAYVNVGRVDKKGALWQADWAPGKPEWLLEQAIGSNREHYVQYWAPGWQQLFVGTENSLLDRIIGLGFDGVYLGGVDAYEHFEAANAAGGGDGGDDSQQ